MNEIHSFHCDRSFIYIGTIVLSVICACAFFLHPAVPFIIALLLFSVVVIYNNLNKSFLLIAILTPLNNMILVKTGITDIRICQVIYIICMGLLALRIVVGSIKLEEYIKFEKYDIAFALYILISYFQSFIVRIPILALRELIQLVYFYSLFIILRSIFAKKMNYNYFIKWMIIVTILFVLVGLANYIFGSTILRLVNIDLAGANITFLKSSPKIQQSVLSGIEIVRADSFFWGSVGTANILIILFYLISSGTSRYIPAIKISIIPALLVTASRAGYIVFFFQYMLGSLFSRKRFLLKIIVGIVCLVMAYSTISIFADRLNEIVSFKEKSNMAHFALWRSGYEMIRNNLLFGVGTGHFMYELPNYDYSSAYGLVGLRTEVHNIILKIFTENGLVGIILLIMVLYGVLRKSISMRILFKSKDAQNIFLAFIGTLLMNMTMNAYMIEIFWVVLALLASLRYRTDENPSYQ